MAFWQPTRPKDEVSKGSTPTRVGARWRDTDGDRRNPAMWIGLLFGIGAPAVLFLWGLWSLLRH